MKRLDTKTPVLAPPKIGLKVPEIEVPKLEAPKLNIEALKGKQTDTG